MRASVVFLLVMFIIPVVFAGCQRAPQMNELILIPAGTFTMGSNSGRNSNQPQHEVHLYTYYIHKTEVTRSQFFEFLTATGYSAEGWLEPAEANGDLPATGVLWKDAAAYCEWAGLRLPTEAEWEKAARGDDGRIYPWSNDWNVANANSADGGPGMVLPVGSYPQGASPYGLLDMSGNAAEWVADYHDPSYYSYSPSANPTGPDTVLDHGLRGGSYASPPEQLTTFFRNSSHSVLPNPRVGFRCAISANEYEP